MGTGVTLTVYSPANLADRVFSHECSNLGRRLAGSFPCSRSRKNWLARTVHPTNWRRTNSEVLRIPHNEIDWVQLLTLLLVLLDILTWSITRLVENLYLRGNILRRVNSMDKPNGRLVLVSYMHYCTSTSSLSTRSSSWTLHFPFGLGDLILERASRLYAFSGYHNRTSLPSRALGRTTGTQEVRPSRSSRTKDSPPQISYAHSR